MSIPLRTLLAGLDLRQLHHVAARWCVRSRDRKTRRTLTPALERAVQDEARLEKRLSDLPEKLAGVLDTFLSEPSRTRTAKDLFENPMAGCRNRFELEACLAALHRECYLFPTTERTGSCRGEPCHAVPAELAASILALRRRLKSEIRDTITLDGHLQTRHFDRTADNNQSDRARKIYQLYLMDSSIQSRIERLPDQVGKLYRSALTGYGGLMPVDEIQKCMDADEAPDLELVQRSLEEAMLGTVAPLRLARFGIQPIQSAVVLFTEVTQRGLQQHSATEPIEVDTTLSSGVDLIGNALRFLRELTTSRVLFTAKGTLYKASQKRISNALLAIPGGFMPRSVQLDFIYRFFLSQHLIDRTGEHALRPTPQGQDFDRLSLQDKLRALLAFGLQERGMPGEYYHQVRLRRILLNLLRESGPESWHEALFLPFLARNRYLAGIDGMDVEEVFAARFKSGSYTPTENLQQICWHLCQFATRRLYPLGLVDLGMRQGRLVALRLSRLGAEILGSRDCESAGETTNEELSTIVANPDFELILFPGDDEHEVVHQLDRFAERLKSDCVYHFRLTRDSIKAGLQDGLPLTGIISELTERSRTPLPQNVLYSLEDWADRAGLLVLDKRTLHSRRPDPIDRLVALPQLEPYLADRSSPTRITLKRNAPLKKLVAALKDHGFLVEQNGGN